MTILYQDEHLLAVNKPTGLLVHRSPIDRHETRFALQLVRDQIGRRVYPVHRLDKPTSGALLFALTPDIARQLGQQFEQHQVRKTYVAVVRGLCEGEGVIDHPLREEIDACADMRTDKSSQPAITHYKHLASVELPYCVDKYPSSRYSLVRCHPLTGRKHQIRRHLKHINHPIIGDAKHGKGRHNRLFQQQLDCHRLLLAATELCFTHPQTQESIQLTAPLEQDFYQLLQRFGWEKYIPHHWAPGNQDRIE
ncbi:tRNA pseudouridine(65) synthase TruC [Cellvibrio japonicus]|nr:tRNA pseudouridine(65) synthase TruC [Cellvibrio japonicus]QEI17741.1 tRNA pseudouridine(65) synthase TruC [Cellvibrio japonicus]QEI21315.1 tRNA pseudouridine(65) synthase TruC [Cellvibrio japonicus]